MVDGPLWVGGRQFGDGCMLLTFEGQSAIIGLGEIKAGFDEDLLTQLFVRSDRRAADAVVRFTGTDGKSYTRTLTREFSFADGTKVPVRKSPIYAYGRPEGEAPETVEAFKKMVEDQLSSGREMWKVQLPFTTASNAAFANAALLEAVRALIKAKPDWGKP
jgi:hypothetical protein